MSELRPNGIDVEIGGKTYDLLFTLNVIDECQARFKKPLSEVMKQLTDPYWMPGTLRTLLTSLINDSLYRSGEQERRTEKEVGGMVTQDMAPELTMKILNAYLSSVPEADGDTEEGEQEMLDVAKLLYIGAIKLGYSETELFQMTPRKFFLLFDAFLELNGLKKKEIGIDDLP